MADNNQTEYTPILPFDSTLGEFFTMYDNTVYHKDNNVCNETNVRMESGNVCKFFRCNVQEPCRIGGD